MTTRDRGVYGGRRRALTLLACCLAVSVGSTAHAACAGSADDPNSQQDDHDHAGGGSFTILTDDLEVFVKFPPQLATAAADSWVVYLTERADWTPAADVEQVSLRLRGPARTDQTIPAQLLQSGQFSAPAMPGPVGTWRADLVLTRAGKQHDVPLGEFEVFASEAVLPHPEAGVELITFPKDLQWGTSFAAVDAEVREIANSFRASGEIVTGPGGLANVSAPVTGLVLADSPVPTPGERVGAGQTIAMLAPVLTEGSYTQLLGVVERADREAQRSDRLFEIEAIPERRLVEAHHEFDHALAAFEAAGGVWPPVQGDEDGAGLHDYVYALRTPIGGVITENHLSPGQLVETGEPAFSVVDPARLRLAALVPARHAAAAGQITEGWLTVEGGEQVHRTGGPVAVGAAIDPVTRTLPVYFDMRDPDGMLKVGMHANVRFALDAPVTGPAVPLSAVQDEDGAQVIYIQTGGDEFVRRAVRLGPSDGEWVIVESGVEAGERVVARGGYQVRLAALGNVQAGHGHTH